MEEVVYLQELWQKRAAVAKECGEELGELARAVQATVRRNYFGIGCVEGEQAFDSLSVLVQAKVASFARLQEEAFKLAESSTAAANHLTEADRSGAGDVAR